MNKISAYLTLMRPANVVTAVADIVAGVAVSAAAYQRFMGAESLLESASLLEGLGWLCLATIGLYGGGVVLNDVFDAELDREERPERPIPSGFASVRSAATFGVLLLVMGVIAALQVSLSSSLIAASVAGLTFSYNAWAKHNPVLGPINMGLCRGGNLLLGVSVLPTMAAELWYLGLIPVFYIAAVTMISRGEVHGATRRSLQGGGLIYAFILSSVAVLTLLSGTAWWEVVPFLALLAYLIFPPLARALATPKPKLVGKAVKAGVLSLIVLNASLASAFAGWEYGILVLVLLPFSLWLAKIFAVT
jgi:4-hydroxybenzoate polyprenyltransferase